MVTRLSFTLLVLVACAVSQQSPKPVDAERDIRALETIRLKNPNKTEVWARNVAKGALFHQGTGVIVGREDFLADANKKLWDDSPEMSDTRFSQFGQVAVFSYVFARTRHDHAHNLRYQHLRRTVVYQYADTGWQMITSSAAVIPWADLEPKAVDPKILDAYVGLWSDTPEPNTVTITRDETKLMAQGSDETSKTELLAISSDTFVVRGEPALITFLKDTDGKARVSKWRDVGGSLQIGRRIERGTPIQFGVR